MLDLQQGILQMTATLETSEVSDYDLSGKDSGSWPTWPRISCNSSSGWIARLAFARAHPTDAQDRELIRKLREDHSGQLPEEIQACLAAADRLEARRNHKLHAG